MVVQMGIFQHPVLAVDYKAPRINLLTARGRCAESQKNAKNRQKKREEKRMRTHTRPARLSEDKDMKI